MAHHHHLSNYASLICFDQSDAIYYGIDPTREPSLLWIAREGMEAPLPDGWYVLADSYGARDCILLLCYAVYRCVCIRTVPYY